MFFDLRPGEWIRVGDVTLTVLGVQDTGIDLAIEGADQVADVDDDAEADGRRRRPPPCL